jgi:hypothetical protein
VNDLVLVPKRRAYLWKQENRVDETYYTENHKDQVGSPEDVLEHDGGSQSHSEIHEPTKGESANIAKRRRRRTHFTADEIDIPLARMSRGKTSAETTQANGPQVTAKVAM